MRRLLPILLALPLLVAMTAPARAFVAQTITVDGVNDFDPSNLLKDDRNDTQSTTCSGATVLPLDLGRVYMTNDANYLYVGVEFSQTCWCNMNLGMAINTSGLTGGGTTDPFGRDIGWANIAYKPNYLIYDVTPTSCNTFNYEVLYKDTLGTWQNRSTSVNPSYSTGANGLGIVDSLNFKEFKIPLGALGLTTGTAMHVEFWVTQEGSTKGPLDALFSDNVQMSHVGRTTFDTTAVVQMTQTGLYTVLSAVDNVPPTMTSATATGFTLLANKQFGLLSNKIDVQFSEPVDLTTSQATGNYAFSGPVARSIISAVRDAASPSLVHLTLNSAIAANAAAYVITATSVKDIAGNVISANNSAGFFIQNLVFNGDFRLPLCNGTFAATDTFQVTGSLSPLSFQLCATGLLTDANADSIYTLTVPFCLERDPATGKGGATLEWKFAHKCNEYEPLGSNRVYVLSSDNGASVTINASWNNSAVGDFLSHAVDVVFKVDASRFHPTGSNIITLMGNAAPLAFAQPGVVMKDDGVAPDAVAGDKIYTARVTFPSCGAKAVEWKVDFDGVYECLGQGNRSFTIDDAVYSQANPLVLPARGIDRCTVTDKAIAVKFLLDTRLMSPAPTAIDTVAVFGSVAPLSWTAPPAAAAWLKDDGVSPDGKANDGVWTRTIVFPDSSATYVNYKYWFNSTLECFGINDRGFALDDLTYSATNPIVRHLEKWDYCTDYVGVNPQAPVNRTGTGFGVLMPVVPNPVARRASFSFDLYRAGRVSLSVYDVGGRRVAHLVDAWMPAGVHTATWEGLNDAGLRLSNGVYMYELAMGAERLSRRMILVR